MDGIEVPEPTGRAVQIDNAHSGAPEQDGAREGEVALKATQDADTDKLRDGDHHIRVNGRNFMRTDKSNLGILKFKPQKSPKRSMVRASTTS